MKSGRRLGIEERILWGKVAKTVRPIMPHNVEDFEALIENSDEVFKQDVTVKKKTVTPQMITEIVQLAVKAEADRVRVHHHPLEKPVKRKLAKGRLPIEAKIDLHGMMQSEAHNVLFDFIRRAYNNQLRHVLIITGKGRSMGSDGALKRAVPLWFSKPEFRSMISSYEGAAINHGGEGALYVRLAKHKVGL